MRQLFFLVSVFFVISCQTEIHRETNVVVKGASPTATFPVKAQLKNPLAVEADTLLARVDSLDFMITPEGNIFWGQGRADSFHLKTDALVETAFLHRDKDTLFVFYTETNNEEGASYFEKIDLKQKKLLSYASIDAFNLGNPYLVGDFAYLTSLGFVGKLNMRTGKYVFAHHDLYDRSKFAFGNFDSIVFKDGLVIFLARNQVSPHIDSVIVNEKNNDFRIIK